MCKYCENTESLLNLYYQPDLHDYALNPPAEWLDAHEYDDLYDIDVYVNTLNEFPALLITGTLPFTVPAIPVHFCPMCGRKLD